MPAFTRAERAIVERLRTPRAVQRWLRTLPYNWEKGGETLRSFRGVVRLGTAHCLEAALAAAVVLEAHGYPPLLLSFESEDKLDHVLFLFRQDGRWGSVARSRDPGLHGRKPVFPSPRELAASYVDAYVDLTGRVTGYAVADLRDLGDYDWRLSSRNVRKVERWLIDYPHRSLPMPEPRYRRALERYKRFRSRFPDASVRPGDSMVLSTRTWNTCPRSRPAASTACGSSEVSVHPGATLTSRKVTCPSTPTMRSARRQVAQSQALVGRHRDAGTPVGDLRAEPGGGEELGRPGGVPRGVVVHPGVGNDLHGRAVRAAVPSASSITVTATSVPGTYSSSIAVSA